MLNIGVRDFGPIREGSITLRPLTVLIGPNNAGKSYMALLTYALVGPFTRPGALSPTPYQPLREVEYELWQLWERSGRKGASAKSPGGQMVRVDELPPEAQTGVQELAQHFVDNIADSLGRELQRCFSSELADLARKTAHSRLALSLDDRGGPWKLGFVMARGQLSITAQEWDFSAQRFVLPPKAAEIRLLRGLFSIFFTVSHYLPAARSGILEAHKALASFVMARLPLAGIERLDVPRFTGAVGDFIGELLRLEPQRRHGAIASVAKFLEYHVCGGNIDLTPGAEGPRYPEIYYQQNGRKSPIHRTSSMVSEMASIVLFLQRVVSEGDLLMIEEPEAHLHPDNQRILARAIVKLIRAGVQVLITTHSDYFLQQLSNFVRLGEAAAKQRTKLGYDETDYLSAKEVGAYLFELRSAKEGSVIKELEVTVEDGIPEQEFVRVAEMMYDETIALERARSRP